MAKFLRMKVLNTIIKEGLVPLFYHADEKVMVKSIQACLKGGASCFEFTNRGDRAYDVFMQVIEQFKDEQQLILGAGTIMDPATAALYIQAGANFIVGPTLNPEIARLCNRRKIAYIPGCGSATEISNAEELGAEICKVFPGGALNGPKFIKSILGPMPWSRLLPTGGVRATEENITSWFEAGAACVGLGNGLFRKDIIQNEQFTIIQEDVKNILEWIRNSRNGKNPIS